MFRNKSNTKPMLYYYAIIHLFIICFMGFFRKLFNDNSSLILMLPYIFLAGSVIVVRNISINKNILVFFQFYFFFILFYSLKSYSFSINILVVSFLNYLILAPLFLVGFALGQRGHRNDFVNIYIKLSLIVCIFAVIQLLFHGLIDSPVMFTLQNERMLTGHSFGDKNIFFVSSFLDVAPRMDSFLMMNATLALYMHHLSSKKVYLFSFLFSFLIIVLSGHRTPGLILAVVLFFRYFRLKAINFKVGIYFVILIGIAIIVAYDSIVFYFYAFVFAQDRLWWTVNEFFYSFINSGLFGEGAGMFSQGVQYLPEPEYDAIKQIVAKKVSFTISTAEYGSGVADFAGVESGVAKTLLEFGLFGCVIYFIFWALIYKKLKSSDFGKYIQIYLISILAWFGLVHHQILGEIVTLSILWLFIGLAVGSQVYERKINANI